MSWPRWARLKSNRSSPDSRSSLARATSWVLMVPLRYGEDILHYVAVLEVHGGRICRGTGYWGAPFPAQASRAPFAVQE